MQPVFAVPIRIYYEDTDAGGVVYHANYLKFLERARTEWLRALGFEQDELASRDHIVFAVRSAALDYLKPVRFNELIEATAAVTARTRTSVTFRQTIRRGDVVVCEAEVRVVCIDNRSFTPSPLPERLVERIEGVKA